MRNLLILVGAPGSGKSTWLKNNTLEEYVLSPDELRLLHASPELTITGEYTIPQSASKDAWNSMFAFLEKRMKQGHFTIIDATHTKLSYFQKYKKLAEKYRYRMWYKKFDCSLDVLNERNINRGYKNVPPDVINRFYDQMQTLEIPSYVTEIHNVDETFEYVNIDTVTNDYKNVFVIGDIHGVHTPLDEFLRTFYDKQSLYIFLGDYVDRGKENAQVMKKLIEISKNDNCIFLEGNHETHLRKWSNNEPDEIRSKQFKDVTLKELDEEKLSKKDTRQFCRNLRLFSYIHFHGNNILCCHGGVPHYNIDKLPAHQLIKGVGNYKDYLTVAESFQNTCPENTYQLFGHRNTESSSTRLSNNVFNLNGDIELKGALRVVKFSNDSIEELEFESDYMFKNTKKLPKNIEKISEEVLINVLRQNDNIREKVFENISSFNFDKKTFYNRIWNDQTVKARGLFINTHTNKIVARSYDKFFNISERRETEFQNLKQTFSYSIKAYKKENGFLGILGYDEEAHKLLFCSKSSPESPYAKYFEDILQDTINVKNNTLMMSLLKGGHSFVFEVIDIKNDPHIIEYKESKVILLDIIRNNIKFSCFDYVQLCSIANKLNIEHKQLESTFESYNEFLRFIDMNKKNENEGFVFVDNNNFTVKLKNDYYNQWKHSRMLIDKIIKGIKIKISDCINIEENTFINFVTNKYSIEDLQNMSLIELRNEFKIIM